MKTLSKGKVDLSKFDNSWFRPGNPLVIVFWYFTNVLFFKNTVNTSSKLKIFFLRLFGAKIAKGVMIKPGINIKYPWKLEIGENAWIGENVWIDNLAPVKIGANACLSQGAMLLTGNHDYKKVTFDLMIGEITLEDGVWIGAKSIVCPGITCHSHAVLTVNSVATRNLDSYTIYQGNPAIAIKKRIIS